MIDLRQGDCLEIMPTLPEQSVDAIITDLPYGSTAYAWDIVIPFVPMWEQVSRVLKPSGVFVTTSSRPFTSALVMSNQKWFRYEWIWTKNNKTGAFNAKYIPLKAHENILVFSSAPSRSNQFTDYRLTYNPQGIKADGSKQRGKKSQSAMNNMRGNIQKDYTRTHTGYPTSVLYFAIDKGLHPTQKPVALYEYLIQTYTNPGEMVMDICAGSGTTGEAAIKTGRNCILIEKNPNYFEIVEKRMAQAQAQPSLLDVA